MAACAEKWHSHDDTDKALCGGVQASLELKFRRSEQTLTWCEDMASISPVLKAMIDSHRSPEGFRVDCDESSRILVEELECEDAVLEVLIALLQHRRPLLTELSTGELFQCLQQADYFGLPEEHRFLVQRHLFESLAGGEAAKLDFSGLHMRNTAMSHILIKGVEICNWHIDMLVAETIEFDNATLVSCSLGGRVSKITAVESRFVQTSFLCQFRGKWDKLTATKSTFAQLSAPQINWMELHQCTVENSTVDAKWAQFFMCMLSHLDLTIQREGQVDAYGHSLMRACRFRARDPFSPFLVEEATLLDSAFRFARMTVSGPTLAERCVFHVCDFEMQEGQCFEIVDSTLLMRRQALDREEYRRELRLLGVGLTGTCKLVPRDSAHLELPFDLATWMGISPLPPPPYPPPTGST